MKTILWYNVHVYIISMHAKLHKHLLGAAHSFVALKVEEGPVKNDGPSRCLDGIWWEPPRNLREPTDKWHVAKRIPLLFPTAHHHGAGLGSFLFNGKHVPASQWVFRCQFLGGRPFEPVSNLRKSQEEQWQTICCSIFRGGSMVRMHPSGRSCFSVIVAIHWLYSCSRMFCELFDKDMTFLPN